MRGPGQAKQRLIQMHMPINQAGQQQIPAQIQHLACRGRRGIGGQDCRNPPFL